MFAISGKMVAVVALVLTCAALPAAAQDGNNNDLTDRLLACDRIGDRLEELACYDSIVELLHVSDAVEATQPEAVAPEKSPPAATAVVVAAAVVAEPVAETVVKPPPTRSAQASAPVPVVEEDDIAVENVATEKVKQKEVEKKKKFETFQATIVDVWRTADDRFAVKLDNGQTWRETAGSRITIPKKGWIVEVTKAGFGGYRMKIENRKRLASVKLQE